MKNTTRIFVLIGFLLPVVYLSCKKDPVKKTTCSSVLHSFNALSGSAGTPPHTCYHNTINTVTAAVTTIGSFSGKIYFTRRAAFNSSDNHYYAFGYTGTMYALVPQLVKVSPSGTTTIYNVPDSAKYSGLTYNPANNKLYCVHNNALAEITASGSTFSVTDVVTPAHLFGRGNDWQHSSITVNRATGDMFFATSDTGTTNYYVEKYLPGSSSTTVVASLSAMALFCPLAEIRYNPNDNMLYGLRIDSTHDGNWSFVKVNPATGSLTVLSDLSTFINPDFYSAVFDACTNRYIISTITNYPTRQPVLHQLNTAGTIVQTDTMSQYHNGLEVQY